MLLARVANTALWASYAPWAWRLRTISDLRRTQEEILRRTLRTNADTDLGLQYGFARLTTPARYREAVPLTTYDDYAPRITQIMHGRRGVLTRDRVTLLEPSSGSTAATKLIPWTRGLRAEFNRGLRPWLHDLYQAFPALRRGRSYWSVTPAVTRPELESQVPIGFDEDAAYLGPLAQRLVNAVFAVPGDVARSPDMETFRRRTLSALLAADDLTLISVWNPTFLTGLLAWGKEHAADLALPRRTQDALSAGDWAALWPRLTVISCWADAHAATPASEFAAAFPHAHLQPKGLLATEGIVSLPLQDAPDPVFAARSHYVEFLDGTDALGAHEVEPGHTYEVALTTAGGLYRYRLGDRVEVTGRHGVLPTLRFVGRADKVSDLVGEKLSEAFVLNALTRAGASGFTLLAPETDRYVLYTDHPVPGLAERLEVALRAGFHYAHARDLGQLRPVEVAPVGPDAAQRHLDACVARGLRLGDIKPAGLALTGGWASVFETRP